MDEIREHYGDEYFDWLCDLVNLRPASYETMMYELYNIDFLWTIELDSNRGYDGLLLRGDFSHGDEELDKINHLKNKPCSVLEALIGLAQRMDYILDDEDRGNRTRLWFWEFVDNLGLRKYTNRYMAELEDSGLSSQSAIIRICDDWMLRRFSYDGRGSPFPLNEPYEDQRTLDMIRQLNAYVLENYMVDDTLM